MPQAVIASDSIQALRQCSFFASVKGVSTGFPVQFSGRLLSGAFCAFRARGANITLVVAEDESHFLNDDLVARYHKIAVVDDEHPFGASTMPIAEALCLTKDWLKRYKAGDRPLEAAKIS